jgi:hypothetical protein
MDVYQYILAFIIFCVILFLYLHIQFHLKVSNELEIYEIDDPSKQKFEEICDIRQPVIINCDEDTSKIIDLTNRMHLLNTYPVFEIKIRDIINNNALEERYIPLQLHSAVKLFDNDLTSGYISESNNEFLSETGAIKSFSYNDSFLRPPLVTNCYYDVLFGSKDAETPFKYELNYRNFFMVTNGSIKIQLAPPKSSKYLYPINDWENLEFRSPINPWNPQNKYKTDFDKIKCLELILEPGRILYIPAYWWYSFKFDDSNTSISCLKYRTYFNNLAICPNIFMYALQNQNVERKIVKKFDIKLLDKKANKIEKEDEQKINIDNTIVPYEQDIPSILAPNHSDETQDFRKELLQSNI